MNIGSAVKGINHNVFADNTVNENLDQLDLNLGDLATITTGKSITTSSNVTAALDDLAKNVEKALGGTFTDGDWEGTVDNSGDVNYTYASSSNVMQAINKVASNLGKESDLTNLYNGVKTTNSVNANIDSINGTIGDITTLNKELGNLTNGGKTDPDTVVQALNNLDATLGRVHDLFDGTAVKNANSTTGSHSNLAVADATVEDHLVSLDNAIGDREIESSNQAINDATKGRNGSVSAGLKAAGDAIGDVDFSSTKYVSAAPDLSEAVRRLDSNMYRIENKVNDLRHDFKSGMASMAAMTALETKFSEAISSTRSS
jgi:hypothetical protein